MQSHHLSTKDRGSQLAEFSVAQLEILGLVAAGPPILWRIPCRTLSRHLLLQDRQPENSSTLSMTRAVFHAWHSSCYLITVTVIESPDEHIQGLGALFKNGENSDRGTFNQNGNAGGSHCGGSHDGPTAVCAGAVRCRCRNHPRR